MAEDRTGGSTIHIWKPAVLIVGLAAFVLLLGDVTGSYRLEGVDIAVCTAVQSLRCPFLTGFFKVMTNMVHPVVLLIISMAMIHTLRPVSYTHLREIHEG